MSRTKSLVWPSKVSALVPRFRDYLYIFVSPPPATPPQVVLGLTRDKCMSGACINACLGNIMTRIGDAVRERGAERGLRFYLVLLVTC